MSLVRLRDFPHQTLQHEIDPLEAVQSHTVVNYPDAGCYKAFGRGMAFWLPKFCVEGPTTSQRRYRQL